MNGERQTPRANVATRLRRMARTVPYKKAVIFPAVRVVRPGRVAYTHLTFRQLDRASDRVAAGLRELGIRRGTRTVLMVRPSLDFFILIFALFKTGAVPVVVDPGMGLRRMVAACTNARPKPSSASPPPTSCGCCFPPVSARCAFMSP
jgi:acyl-CoA synthetase (AMP-forming)/AMP-acid ligase II